MLCWPCVDSANGHEETVKKISPWMVKARAQDAHPILKISNQRVDFAKLANPSWGHSTDSFFSITSCYEGMPILIIRWEIHGLLG